MILQVIAELGTWKWRGEVTCHLSKSWKTDLFVYLSSGAAVSLLSWLINPMNLGLITDIVTIVNRDYKSTYNYGVPPIIIGLLPVDIHWTFFGLYGLKTHQWINPAKWETISERTNLNCEHCLSQVLLTYSSNDLSVSFLLDRWR